MYNEFFGFSENPFEAAPDPKFLYLTRRHQALLTSIMDSLRGPRSPMLVTGEVGTGKTTLIHSLLKKLGDRVRTVFIFHTTIPFKELAKGILHELDLDVDEKGKQAILNRLNEYLARMPEDESVAVIIDEAQDLPERTAAEIGELIVDNELVAKKIQFIFAGQPEFPEKLLSQRLGRLNQSITLRHEITALTEEESKEYIDHRLGLVGSSCLEAFTPEAVSLIVKHARGIPRVINILCDNAFLEGYALSRKRIDVDIVRAVIKDREGFVTHRVIPLHAPAILKEWRRLTLGLTAFNMRVCVVILPLLFVAVFLFYGPASLRPESADTVAVGPIEIVRADTSSSASFLPASSGPREMNPVSSSREASSGRASLLTPRSAAPLPSSPPRNVTPGDPIAEPVAVKHGQTISSIAEHYYGMTNKTLCELILQSNPGITNIHFITVDQIIHMPKISEERLVLPSPDRTFKLFAGTFWSPTLANVYQYQPALKGKNVEIIPRNVSPEETWYRVEIGPFDSKQAVLEAISQLKAKGLLPLFETGVEKKEPGLETVARPLVGTLE
jgi:general secretion pathway protein A